MALFIPPSLRKRNLCILLRSVAQAFLAQTDDGKPASAKETVQLRNEADSLITLYELNQIDPVEALREAPLSSSEIHEDPATAPLTGTHG